MLLLLIEAHEGGGCGGATGCVAAGVAAGVAVCVVVASGRSVVAVAVAA